MKKFLSFCLISLCCAFSMIFSGCEINTYTLEQNAFETTIAYGSNIDFSSLTITKNAGKENESSISVTSDMIVSYGETDSVGKKQAVIEFEDQTLTIDYWVKYKVEFFVEDTLYNSQYVLSFADLIVPERPTLAGYDFLSWDRAIPEEINDNQIFNARFTVEGSGVPKLSTIKATYGDTLQAHPLPQNSKGTWTYVMPQTTFVGNAGTNTFEVVFTPAETGLVAIYDYVTINVAKKTLEFLDIQTSFDYDGTEKFPTYNLSVDGIDVEYIPYYQDQAIDSGEYEFELEIVDDNYKGSYYGSFCINKVNANIIIENKEIKITDDKPSVYEYSIKTQSGEDLPQTLQDIIGLEIVSPEYNHAGTYPISATITNTNFNVNVQNGYLTVQKVEHDLTDSDPVFTTGYYVVYGDKLSSMQFEESDVRGTWSFAEDDYQVLTPGQITVDVVFTPHELTDFLPTTKQITLNVNKKVLNIVIDQSEFTYDGEDHSIIYSVEGILACDENSVVVDGNLTRNIAGEYNAVLNIGSNDLRYVGSTNTRLIIHKARLADFSTIYTTEWNSSLLLGDIVLPERYVWEKPLTHITNLGKQNFVATYTPADTTNYEIETNTFAVEVTKATATITLPESYTFEYTTTGNYVFTNISANHSESNFEYTYQLSQESVDRITNAGTYTLCVTLPESEHYKTTTKTAIVHITKVINKDVLTNNIDAVYGDRLSKFTLPTSTLGIWQWQDSQGTVGNAGTQTHKAVFTPNNTTNYEGRVVDITFIVDKKVVQIPTIDAKTYDGSVLTADIQDTDVYVVTQNNGGQDMGSYDVVLTLKDSFNYRWAGNNTPDTITTQFSILKNANNKWIESPYVESFEYGVSTARYIASSAYGEVSVTFTEKTSDAYTFMRPTNIGEYFVKFVVQETESYNGLEAILEFSITHRIVSVPTLDNIIYTGEQVCANIQDTEAYTVEQNDLHTDVGEYVVRLKLVNDNYKWNDGSEDVEREIKYSIVKNTNNSWTNEPTISGWAYNPNGGNQATASANFGNVEITYKEKCANNSTSYTSTLPVNAGAYTARFYVADTKNYNGLEKTVDFVITQAMPTLNAPTYDMSKAYYENSINVESIYTAAPSVANNVEGTITFAKATLETQTVATDKTYEKVGFNIIFTPADTHNYQVVTATAYINLYKVAYIGSTYYGSIENAIEKALSGDTIMVIPDASGNVTIARDITINSGVTLALPYINYYGEIEINTNGKATVSSAYDEVIEKYCSGFSALNLTNKVVVKSNVTITNNGSIIIGGELSAGNGAAPQPGFEGIYKMNGIAGNTGRNYAKIVLQNNAKILSNGIFNCYGYLDESAANNGSELIANQGKVYMPYILHDFRGGNYMYSAISYSEGSLFNKTKIPITPYNQYEFRNIIPKFTIKYNAQLIGYANLHAGEQVNHTEGLIVGNSSDAFIQLTSENSYLVAKYNITQRPADGSDKWEEGVSDIHLYGGAVSNVVSLKVKVLTEMTISSKDFFFPLTWRQSVTLHDGDYTMLYKFKLLPGAKLIIESDASLTANQLTIYDDTFIDKLNKSDHNIPTSTQYNYGRTTIPAEFIVKGSMTVTSLGGKVIAGAEGAVVSVTNTSCKSYEVASGVNNTLAGVKIGWSIKSVYITGAKSYLQNGSNIMEITSGGTYTARDGTWSK